MNTTIDRRALKTLRWALMGLELCRNGLKNRRGLKETDDHRTCDPEMWNLRMAMRELQSVCGRWNPKTKRWAKRIPY